MQKNITPEWERISQIISHYNFDSVSAFARHLGLHRSENLHQIKRGNNGISRLMAERIAGRFPQLSKAWILTGEGSMFPQAETNLILHQIAGIPFYPDFPTKRPPDEPDKFLYFSKELIADVDFAIPCRTDELYPVYKKNTVIFLRRCSLEHPVIYGEMYFIVTDYCRIFRIIRRAANADELSLESSYSEKYDKVIIPKKDVFELYRLIQ